MNKNNKNMTSYVSRNYHNRRRWLMDNSDLDSVLSYQLETTEIWRFFYIVFFFKNIVFLYHIIDFPGAP